MSLHRVSFLVTSTSFAERISPALKQKVQQLLKPHMVCAYMSMCVCSLCMCFGFNAYVCEMVCLIV